MLFRSACRYAEEETIDEVMAIQKEGREKRKAAEVELLKIEGELKSKLLEVKS